MIPAARTKTFDDFLIEEYGHVAESLLRNEEDGEKRVSSFVNIVTAVGAALAFTVGRDMHLPFGPRAVAGAALLAMLALGQVTLSRVITRNAASDRYKESLNRIRLYFLSGPQDLNREFLPFDPYHVAPPRRLSFLGFGSGGWLETVTLVNALIVGALTADIVSRFDPWRWPTMLAAPVAAVAARVALAAYANRRYDAIRRGHR